MRHSRTRLAIAARSPVMVLSPNFVSLMPRVAWQFDSTTTKRVPVGGWRQGATLAVGNGRVVAFGEAAMSSAHVAGPQRRPMGMNAPGAEQKAHLVISVVRWLTGSIPDSR